MRAHWYEMMTTLEGNESMQRYGLVVVVLGMFNSKVLQMPVRFYGESEAALPVRITAFHLCISSQQMNPMTRFVLTAVGSQVRLRLRIHLEGTGNVLF